MKKINCNNNKCKLNCPDVDFIILDNNHLTANGVKNLIDKTRRLFLVTKNKKHPAFKFKDKLELIYYSSRVNFKDLFRNLKMKWGINRVTIQSGGTLNSILFKEKLIDRISFVFAPCIIGGGKTSTLVDGKDLISEADLKYIRSLRLKEVNKLKNNYLHLVYYVNN